jgi:hypothetical protein
MVDTAAPWCIFDSEVGEMLREHFAPVSGELSLSTRLGLFRGSLYRAPLAFSSTAGGSFEVEATVFVSPDWPGGNFLGYGGLLQRIRFAIDPETNLFYFGQI